MSCSNCFNGCSEITSDKCVKYTGIDIPLLGIKKGDSLSYVEQAIIGFLSSTLDGTGIKFDIDQNIVCDLFLANLPDCGDFTVITYVETLVKCICDLQTRLLAAQAEIDALNTAYDVDCLAGITDNTDTHEVLQVTIATLCATINTLDTFISEVQTDYVKLADLDGLIQAYLNSISASDKLYTKMVPYTVVEYYGALTGFPTVADGFDNTGKGYGAWENIYLCNGQNFTPDKRGRVGVGVSNGAMGGAALDADRLAFPYSLNIPQGTNTITLAETQMPTHTHAISIDTITDPGHYHYQFNTSVLGTSTPEISSITYPIRAVNATDGASDLEYAISGTATESTLGKTSTNVTNISATASAANAGSSQAHNNFQPGLGCYYIMYIP